MNFLDEYKILVGGYYGVIEMDAYILKEYVLQDIENYIKTFIEKQNFVDISLQKIADELQKNLTLKRKLQDALLTLHKVKGPFELEHMIKLRLAELNKEN